jgi:hypothetical protein
MVKLNARLTIPPKRNAPQYAFSPIRPQVAGLIRANPMGIISSTGNAIAGHIEDFALLGIVARLLGIGTCSQLPCQRSGHWIDARRRRLRRGRLQKIAERKLRRE